MTGKGSQGINNLSKKLRDKCDNCGSVASKTFWDYADQSVLCDECHRKIGNEWQQELNSMGSRKYHNATVTPKYTNKIAYAIFILAAISVILLIIVSVLYLKLSDRKQENEDLTHRLADLNRDYDSLTMARNACMDEVGRINKDYEDAIKDYENCREDYNQGVTQVQRNVDETMDELREFETKVKDSMSWFRSNNNIATNSNYTQLKYDLDSDCIVKDRYHCEIKLPCIYFMGDYNFDIKYEEDFTLYGEEDRLQSLSEFWQNKAGDCEDQALLFTAEYNYLVDSCNMDRSKISVETMEYDEGSSYGIWKGWYYPNHRTKKLGSEETYMYPVCGTITDPALLPITSKSAGHCVVALTKNEIKTSEDIYRNLKDAVFIEPQSGYYINYSTVGIYDNGYRISSDSYFYIIILKDDIKYFRMQDGANKWQGYSEFYEDIKNLEKELPMKLVEQG